MIERSESLVELGEQSFLQYRDRPLFGTKRGGEWQWTTYGEIGTRVAELRAGLATLGVGEGDRVAIVSNNRVEWAVTAYAIYGLGATLVPLYEAQRPEEWAFVLGDCKAKVAFGSTEAVVTRLEKIKEGLPRLEHVVGFERAGDGIDSYDGLMARGRAHPVPSFHPHRDSLAGLIYTSGTTGKPKGVMLTHANITSNVAAGLSVFPVTPEDRTLSFLPWAHAYGQVIELHLITSAGASTAFNTALPKLLDELAEVKPTILVAVPRIFRKLYGSVTAELDAQRQPIRALLYRALRTATRKRLGDQVGVLDELALAFADRIAFSKIRAKLGGRMKYAISASAQLGLEVAELIDAVGIEVHEGYGLTETSPIVTSNRPGTRKLGSVGKPIPGVRVAIQPLASEPPGHGEIIVHGPNVMKGYYERPEENANAMTPDGGLRTGDIGYLDEDGFLYVTGRIKEQYKLENGKYVSPAMLEEELKLSPYILNVMVEGANRPFSAAVVVLDPHGVATWARENAIVLGPDHRTEAAVRELIASEMDRLGGAFRSFERPRDFVLTTEDFTMENGLLTPTLKIKRRAVYARYAAQIDALYRAPGGAPEVQLHP